jgi:hypothetical protein
MALALTKRRPIRGMEAVAERSDGTRVPFNMFVDITERHEVE